MPHVLDGKLAALRETAERIGQNLVELELDSSRQLLEASALEGESASRWAAASAQLTELWQWHGLLQTFVERAEKLRDGRRWGELRDHLEGQSIELSTLEVPLANRNLLEGSEVTLRCTADQLLVRMSHAFDQVKTVVALIGNAWETLIPRLDAAQHLLSDCTRVAAELGQPSRADLESAGRELIALRSSLSADPLSATTSEIDRLTQAIAEIRRELDSSAAIRRELDRRVDDAHELLLRIRKVIDQAHAAHREALVKISVPTAPDAPEMPDELDAGLLQVQARAKRGQWSEAGRVLDELTVKAEALGDQAARSLTANRAPIEARNQFRALLDAYQVKAKRLGMVEDPELAEIYAQARDELYTAPTDLALVGVLVRRYQEALGGPNPKREAMR